MISRILNLRIWKKQFRKFPLLLFFYEADVIDWYRTIEKKVNITEKRLKNFVKKIVKTCDEHFPGNGTSSSLKKFKIDPKCLPHLSIRIHPSASVKTSIRPENIARSILSCCCEERKKKNQLTPHFHITILVVWTPSLICSINQKTYHITEWTCWKTLDEKLFAGKDFF